MPPRSGQQSLMHHSPLPRPGSPALPLGSTIGRSGSAASLIRSCLIRVSRDGGGNLRESPWGNASFAHCRMATAYITLGAGWSGLSRQAICRHWAGGGWSENTGGQEMMACRTLHRRGSAACGGRGRAGNIGAAKTTHVSLLVCSELPGHAKLAGFTCLSSSSNCISAGFSLGMAVYAGPLPLVCCVLPGGSPFATPWRSSPTSLIYLSQGGGGGGRQQPLSVIRPR